MKQTIGGFLAAFAFLISPALANAQSAPAPTLTLTANKASIIAALQPVYADLPILSWSSANATLCVVSGSGWSGPTMLNGTQKVNPPVTTTYTMTCAGDGGSITKNVTITVVASSQIASVLSGFEQATNKPADQAASQTQTDFVYAWNRNLQIGSPYPADISALQIALTREDVYTGDITGGFYNQTFAAVKSFQKKYGIKSTGFVGPLTRTKLNALYGE